MDKAASRIRLRIEPPNVGFPSPHRGGNSDLCDSLWRFDYILSEYHITTREFSRR